MAGVKLRWAAELAISVVCATVYGVTVVIIGLPYPKALAVIARFLDLIPVVADELTAVTGARVAAADSEQQPA